MLSHSFCSYFYSGSYLGSYSYYAFCRPHQDIAFEKDPFYLYSIIFVEISVMAIVTVTRTEEPLSIHGISAFGAEECARLQKTGKPL